MKEGALIMWLLHNCFVASRPSKGVRMDEMTKDEIGVQLSPAGVGSTFFIQYIM